MITDNLKKRIHFLENSSIIINELSKKLLEFVIFFNIDFCETLTWEKKAITLRDINFIIDFWVNVKGLTIADSYKHVNIKNY